MEGLGGRTGFLKGFSVAAVLALAVFAVPSRGANLSTEAEPSGPGDPEVFAVGEIEGWVSRPQFPGLANQGVASSSFGRHGRRRSDVYEDRRWGRAPRRSSTPEVSMVPRII